MAYGFNYSQEELDRIEQEEKARKKKTLTIFGAIASVAVVGIVSWNLSSSHYKPLIAAEKEMQRVEALQITNETANYNSDKAPILQLTSENLAKITQTKERAQTTYDQMYDTYENLGNIGKENKIYVDNISTLDSQILNFEGLINDNSKKIADLNLEKECLTKEIGYATATNDSLDALIKFYKEKKPEVH